MVDLNYPGFPLITYGCVMNHAVSMLSFMFLAGQRFGCFPDEVPIVEGGPLSVSVCYMPFMPEAATLETVMLVEEASGNKSIAFFQNYSAHYSVEDPAPGSYHFQVSTGDHGHMNSASFMAAMQGRWAWHSTFSFT